MRKLCYFYRSLCIRVAERILCTLSFLVVSRQESCVDLPVDFLSFLNGNKGNDCLENAVNRCIFEGLHRQLAGY
jgi:hypothetical protein